MYSQKRSYSSCCILSYVRFSIYTEIAPSDDLHRVIVNVHVVRISAVKEGWMRRELRYASWRCGTPKGPKRP